jgi:hypothetical protein
MNNYTTVLPLGISTDPGWCCYSFKLLLLPRSHGTPHALHPSQSVATRRRVVQCRTVRRRHHWHGKLSRWCHRSTVMVRPAVCHRQCPSHRPSTSLLSCFDVTLWPAVASVDALLAPHCIVRRHGVMESSASSVVVIGGRRRCGELRRHVERTTYGIVIPSLPLYPVGIDDASSSPVKSVGGVDEAWCGVGKGEEEMGTHGRLPRPCLRHSRLIPIANSVPISSSLRHDHVVARRRRWSQCCRRVVAALGYCIA